MRQRRQFFTTAVLGLALCGMAAGQVEVTTNHNDGARTGANLSETILNTSNVNVTDFGKLFSRTVDGEIYAQPLYLSQVLVPGQGTHNVVYAATEHNTVYAFDADNAADSAPLWKVNLGPSVPSSDICQDPGSSSFCPYIDLAPEIGITSTPVIDPATGTLYVVAKTKAGSSYQFLLHALDAATGAEKFGGPVQITAAVPGSGSGSDGGRVRFDALQHLNRPGLLLLKGVVYIAFGAVGDVPPFHGWVMGYDAATLRQVSIFNASPDGEGAGIWAGGQGLATDGNSIFLATGNGTFDGNSGGRDWGDSFLRLNPSTGLAVADYFTPHDQGYLSSADLDVGGGGPVLLPNSLLVGLGKDGTLRLLNQNQFGQFNATFDNNVQTFQASSFFLGAPIFWSGPHGPAVYLWSVGDYLKQYAFAGSQLQTTAGSQSSMTAVGGISDSVALSLSANGSAPGTGVVWAAGAYAQDSSNQLAGILRAFDADDLSHELWDSLQNGQRDDLGTYAKFAPPTVVNGKVYVPTFSDKLVVYGLTNGDFSLNTESTLTLNTGSASTAVRVIPQAEGLTKPVTFSCSGLPVDTSCNFSPASLPAGSSPMQSTLTVSSTSTAATGRDFPLSFPAAWFLVGGVAVGGCPLLAVRKRRARWLVLLVVASAGLLALWGCGGSGSSVESSTSAQPTSLQFAVVATSGGIQHRTAITLLRR